MTGQAHPGSVAPREPRRKPRPTPDDRPEGRAPERVPAAVALTAVAGDDSLAWRLAAEIAARPQWAIHTTAHLARWDPPLLSAHLASRKT